MIKFISWLGTFTSILGSFIVAMQIFVWGYTLFLIGSISWLIVAITKKDLPLGILNGTFLCANILGLYKAIM